MSQIKYLFTTFSRYLRGSSLSENIVCLILTSFSGYSVSFSFAFSQNEKDKITLGKRLLSFNNPNPHQLRFNLSPRVFFVFELRIDCISDSIEMWFSHFNPDLAWFYFFESKGKKTFPVHTTMKQLRNNEIYSLFSFLKTVASK